MLSRVAENLYWMSRNIERAENLARLLGVGFDLELDAAGLARDIQGHGPIERVLTIPMARDAYEQVHGAGRGRQRATTMLRFLTFETTNAQSIIAKDRAGTRERPAPPRSRSRRRGLEPRQPLPTSTFRRERSGGSRPARSGFFERVKQARILFDGLIDSTLARNEVFHFIQLGRHLERVDQISRIIAAESRTLHEPETGPGPPLRLVHLTSLLQSCSAYESYLRSAHERIDPQGVVRYLVLDPSLGAVRFCVTQCRDSLHEISGGDIDGYGSEAEPPPGPARRRAALHRRQRDLSTAAWPATSAACRRPATASAMRSIIRISADLPRTPHHRLSRVPARRTFIMLLRIQHETKLRYSDPVAETVFEVRMSPQTDEDQTNLGYRLRITSSRRRPLPRTATGSATGSTCSTSATPYQDLAIQTTSLMRTHRRDGEARLAEVDLGTSGALGARSSGVSPAQRAGQPLCRSRRLRGQLPGRPRGGPWPDGVLAVMDAVRARLKYEKKVTTARTPVCEALALGRGVCQDFAHLFLGACRGIGLPARYVSGYVSGPGELATHAWCQVWGGRAGWVDVDPTRGKFVDDHYVVTAVGRDFADVPPNRGVWKGHADEVITVAVKVEPTERMPPDWAEWNTQTPWSAANAWTHSQRYDRRHNPLSKSLYRQQQSQQQQ